MSQKAITINTPSSAEAHITADDDAFIYDSILGGKSGILGALTCKKVNNNTVRLSGGGASNMGYVLYVPKGESEDLTVNSGAQGVKRYDLVAAQFTRGSATAADKLVFTVITGTAGTSPSDPALVTSDLLSAGDINQVPLFRITINGTTLTAIDQIADSLPSTVGRMLYVGSSEPETASEGDIWFVTE